MIEIDRVPLLGGERVEVAVVGVVGDPLDAILADLVVDRLRDSRLPRAGSAGDADDDGSLHRLTAAPRALLRSRNPTGRPHRTCCTPPGRAFRCGTRTGTSAFRTEDR